MSKKGGLVLRRRGVLQKIKITCNFEEVNEGKSKRALRYSRLIPEKQFEFPDGDSKGGAGDTMLSSEF